MYQFEATLHDRYLQSTHKITVEAEPGGLTLHWSDGHITHWAITDIESTRRLDDSTLVIQNGKQFLELKGEGLERALNYSFPGNKFFVHKGFFDRIGLAGCLISILLLVLPFLLFYFFGSDWLANNAAKQIPKSYEIELGEALKKSTLKDLKIDSLQTIRIQAFYESLQYASDYPISVTVVNDPVINAFAMPGGAIVVFDSILRIMDHPSQLAALLGHEVSHIQQRHTTRTLFKQLSSYLFLQFLFGNYGDITGIIIQQGDQIAGLSYSRSLELEADEKGLELMKKSGIPRKGMAELFQKMSNTIKTEAEDAKMPDFLSTHPSMEERIKIVSEKIANDRPSEVPAQVLATWKVLVSGR